MNISVFAADYLVDKKEEMRQLTEPLLNEVMQLEALHQIQAQPYERNGKRRAHVTEPEIEISKLFTEM